MSLRARLILALVAILGTVAIAGTIGALIVAGRDRDNSRLRDLTSARRHVDELTTTYTDQQNSIVAYLVAPQRFVLQPYEDGIPASERLVRTLRSELAPYPALREKVDVVAQDADGLRRSAADPAIRLLQAGQSRRAVLTILDPKVRDRFDQLRSTLRALGRGVDHEARQVNARRNRANRWLLVTLLATGAVLVAGLVVTAILVGRWTTRPISQIATAVRSVQQGALDTPVPAVGPPDLAALGHDVDQMRARIIRELSETNRAREAIEQNATVALTLRQLLEAEPAEIGRAHV